MTGLVVIIVVGIQGWLESQGREETHPEDGYISLVVLGIGRRVYFGDKGLLLPLWPFDFYIYV